MAVDIYLTAETGLEALSSVQPLLTLEDEHLEGLFVSIRKFTGPSTSRGGPAIDEYGTNVFTGPALIAFREALARALEHFRAGPEHISVHVGSVVKPEQREVFQQVSRDTLVSLAARLEALAQEAIRAGQNLVIVGE